MTLLTTTTTKMTTNLITTSINEIVPCDKKSNKTKISTKTTVGEQ